MINFSFINIELIVSIFDSRVTEMLTRLFL